MDFALSLLNYRQSFLNFCLYVNFTHSLLLRADFRLTEFDIVGAQATANKIVLCTGAKWAVITAHTFQNGVVEGGVASNLVFAHNSLFLTLEVAADLRFDIAELFGRLSSKLVCGPVARLSG